jgi:two-component system alkaline phosphatase synthesis response regulator PhoP
MIYILEDDDSIRKLISFSLANQGFECRAFRVPSEFWNAIAEKKPDLVLLDLLLPEEDGISVLKKLRADDEFTELPVIIITAKDAESDISNGLDTGADDYIVKPFVMSNLISRIKAVLRRCTQNLEKGFSKYLVAGPIKLDLYKHMAYSNDQQIMLTLKEFDLLAVLIENRGNVMSREQLLNLIWNINAAIESRTVDVHIRTLRQKIGDLNAEFIQTVRGVGYKVGAV